MSRLHFAFIVLIRCNEGVTTNLLEAYPPCSSILERPLRDLPRSLPARATSSSRSCFDGARHEETRRERPLRETYQGRSQPERPAQSNYLKSLQPERPAQVARILTGRDTKKCVGSDLLERLC
ncbi:hypothetical protein F2Q69_00007620 [Brassica cretica]|uniref:Uncharacterized protein n=1 Tax=Brassica cretica TaxID=69181 RepID=A0A8S9PAN6_BRACR|nr:hypothetical protein F2Q69_00007620 [Brassica cretica]